MIKCTAPVKKPHAPRVNHTLKEDRQQRVNRRKTRSPIITSTPLKTKSLYSESGSYEKKEPNVRKWICKIMKPIVFKWTLRIKKPICTEWTKISNDHITRKWTIFEKKPESLKCTISEKKPIVAKCTLFLKKPNGMKCSN